MMIGSAGYNSGNYKFYFGTGTALALIKSAGIRMLRSEMVKTHTSSQCTAVKKARRLYFVARCIACEQAQHSRI